MREQRDTPQRGADDRRTWTNQERLRTYWPELRGRAQERWSRLTDEWLGEIEGRHDRLAAKLREAYGVSEQEANRQVDDFVETHWGALSAASMTPQSTTRETAGARNNTVTNTPASAAAGSRQSTDTTRKHAPGPTGIDTRSDDSGVGTGTISPGGRKI